MPASFRQVLEEKARPVGYQVIGYRYMEMVADKFGSVQYRQLGGEPHGFARFDEFKGFGCSPVIAAPNPTSAVRLYVLVHEVGHILLGHHTNGRWFKACGNLTNIKSTLEYEAETFALDAMKSEGIKLPGDVVRNAYLYVASFIVKDARAGHRINPKALAFARKAVNKKGVPIVDLALAKQVDLTTHKGCV